MKPWYATNARQLLENRQRGLLPDGPVVVSLVGPKPSDLAAVTLQVHSDMPAERLEWRMLVNLEVWIWADASVPLERVLLIADRIAGIRPRRLVLRFSRPFSFTWNDGREDRDETINTHDVEIGAGYHHRALADIPEQHDFLWCPVNASGTPIGAQLTRALAATHRLGTML